MELGIHFDRVCQHLKGWKEKLFSHAGKEILLKLVMQAVSSYAMSELKFPKGNNKVITDEIFRSWWDDDGVNKKLA